MDAQSTFDSVVKAIDTTALIGAPIQWLLGIAAVALAAAAILPPLRRWLGHILVATSALLLAGELVLVWFHWRIYESAVVVNPQTGQVTGHIAVPLWIESEKLYVWAVVVAVMALAMRRHRNELLPGVALLLAGLVAGATVWGRPFTEPLPSFFGQYGSYLTGMASGVPAMSMTAYEGMEGARQFFYNTWYMWVHPPLLFVSYGAFTVSFVATLQMVKSRYSAYETTAYRWARLGYTPLTAGMLLGFPWAILAWQGESWWWSGKVNMSIMMWLLYTAYLHARLYLRRRGMWRLVALVAILSFLVLLLTYLATYVIPGAHSYA
ncbi:MAG: cytochrome c biogenesis protein [Coriobacteriia bacterium]|nr:cytochrome c biogenesis protein [Coriobacteriia bacterium]